MIYKFALNFEFYVFNVIGIYFKIFIILEQFKIN